jgi:C_GCAxxG_C_C family probable redox protein
MIDSKLLDSPEEFKREVQKRAYDYECDYHGCSQAVLRTFQELLNMEDDLLLKAAGPLCAGLGSGKGCGALTAGVLVIGMVHGRARPEEGLGGLLRGFELAQTLVRRFEGEFGTTSCAEISGVDWADPEAVARFLGSPESERACRVAAKTAEIVADLLIQEAGRE